MARKKKAPKKDFWTKMLSATKVKRTLETIGVDSERFEASYLADTSRVSRRLLNPENFQVKAIEAFLESGDSHRLMEDLGTKNKQTANAAVSRVIQWKAQKD